MHNKLIQKNSFFSDSYLYFQHYQQKIFNKRYVIQKTEQVVPDGYSLSPFFSTKTVHIHIPKWGGTSINKSFYGCMAGGHTSLSTYTKILHPKEFKTFFKFAFVRNPWDRLVSAYYYLKSDKCTSNDRIWSNRNIGHIYSFEEFVLNWLDKNRILTYYHLIPQYLFVTHNIGLIKVDFIGFFENIKNDYESIADMLNIKNKLDKYNSGNHTDYKYYYNDKMIEKVYSLYKKDVELFEYDFLNENIKTQIKNRNKLRLNYFL